MVKTWEVDIDLAESSETVMRQNNYWRDIPVGMDLLKVNNINTRTRSEIGVKYVQSKVNNKDMMSFWCLYC